MTNRTLFLSFLMLSAAVAVPASAERKPVAAQDLTHFVGREVYGDAHADLGIVAEVDSHVGLVGVAGKNGEFAVLHTSLLMRDGLQMYAPALSVGYLKSISTLRESRPGMAAVAKPTKTPSITIEEPPFTVEPYDQLPSN